MTTTYATDLTAIRSAAAVLNGVAHRTPVATCATLDAIAERELFFKCENFQKVGAFKFRGAFHAVSRLSAEDAARGVVTHSSGNHAQALALSARLRGIPATVVMPRTASPPKKRAVLGYGARVVDCEPTLAAREKTAAGILEETGGVLICPYDDPDVITGQGTATLELMQQVPGLDTIVAPVGGGGLLSGACMAAAGLDPSVRVYGAEPKGADDAARSLAAGELIPQTAPNTIADGLLTSLGQHTWPIIRDHCAGIPTVEEEDIVRTMRLIWERAKLMIETSCAVAVAVALEQLPPDARRVGVILSGGNVDLDNLPW